MARETVPEAPPDGDRKGRPEKLLPVSPAPSPGQPPGAPPLLGLHHLLVRGRGRVAVGGGRGVGHASVRRAGLDLESHGHGIASRIHPWSSGVGVVGQPRRLGSWKAEEPV